MNKFELEFLKNDDSSRPETGPCQAENDWPGIFIRGDNAFGFSVSLNSVLQDIKNGKQPSLIELMVVEGLLETLKSCNVEQLKNIKIRNKTP
jgi:hypothetical protein